MNSYIKRLLNKDLIIAYLYRGSGVILAFVLNIVLARIYGKELSGDYYVLYNFLAFISSVVFLGFGYVIVHYFTPQYSNGNSSKGNLLLSISLITILVLGLFIGVLVFIFRDYVSTYLFDNNDYSHSIILVIIAIIPYVTILLFTEIFKSIGKPNQSILAANIIGNLILIILLIAYQKKDINSIYISFIVSYSAAAIILFFAYRKTFSRIGIKLISPHYIKNAVAENYDLCKTFRKENLTLSLVAISNILLSVFDTFVISHQLTSGDVALYSVANKVVSFGSIILTTVNSLIGFQIAELSYKNEKKALSNILIKYTKIMIPLGFVYYIFAVLFGMLIPRIFGLDYTGSINMCYILAAGQFISIVTGPCSYFAIMTGHARKYTEITIISAAISVVLNLLLVPIFGIYGSVISNIITLFYKNIHTFMFTKGTVNLKVSDFIKLRG